jgi:hypothetical protein
LLPRIGDRAKIADERWLNELRLPESVQHKERRNEK